MGIRSSEKRLRSQRFQSSYVLHNRVRIKLIAQFLFRFYTTQFKSINVALIEIYLFYSRIEKLQYKLQWFPKSFIKWIKIIYFFYFIILYVSGGTESDSQRLDWEHPQVMNWVFFPFYRDGLFMSIIFYLSIFSRKFLFFSWTDLVPL